MLYIKDLNIHFGNKIIFENAEFIAKKGDITIIRGKSGIGKSTFLQALLFKHPCYYEYDGIVLSSLSSQQQTQFQYDNIGFIQQVPQFLNGMKSIEHIQQFQKLGYQRNKELEEMLNIKSMESKLPKNLSGGERTRLALYLMMMKQPNILILDEPTSALDVDYTHKIIDILKKYSKEHIVIIASHDQNMIKQGTQVYDIYNHQFIPEHRIEHISQENKIFESQRHKKYKKFSIKFGYKAFRITMLCLVSLTFIILIYSSHMYHLFQSNYEEQLNHISTREFIVYKEKYKNDYYSGEGLEFPLLEDEIKKIKDIDHVENVDIHIDSLYDDLEFYSHYYDGASKDNLKAFQVYDNQKLVNENYIDEDIKFHSFNSDNDYDNQLLYKFQDNGVILSEELFKKLGISIDDLKKPTLSFNLLIPQYNANGINRISNDDGSSEYPCNYVMNSVKKINTPIQGVLKGTQAIYNYLNKGCCDLFIPKDIYEKYIEEYYPKKAVEIFFINIDNKEYTFYDVIPSQYAHYDILQHITQAPWMPNSVIVKVDNINYYNDVIEEVKKLGFEVASENVDSNIMKILTQDNDNILLTFFISVILITYAFYIYLKYLVLKEEISIREYLASIGMNFKESQYIIRKNYFKNFITLALMTSIIFYILVEMVAKMQIIPFIIPPKAIYFVFIIVMSFILEIVIPLVLNKMNRKFLYI